MKIELVSTEMKMGALKEAATGLGVTYRVGMTKEDLVEQINEAIVAQDPTVEVIEVDEKKLIGPVETQEVPEADKVEQEEKEKKELSKREQEALYVKELKQKPVVQAILDKAKTKADAIRALLAEGIERKYVARIMNIRYQMVYQVEQRMLAAKKLEEIKKQAMEVKDVIKEIGLEQAKESGEYSEELLVEVEKLLTKEGKEGEAE